MTSAAPQAVHSAQFSSSGARWCRPAVPLQTNLSTCVEHASHRRLLCHQISSCNPAQLKSQFDIALH